VITVHCDGASTRRIAFGDPEDLDAHIVIDFDDVRRNCANNAIRDQIQLPRDSQVSRQSSAVE